MAGGMGIGGLGPNFPRTAETLVEPQPLQQTNPSKRRTQQTPSRCQYGQSLLDNILLQDDGDFEIIIENAAETDDGIGAEINSLDGDADNNESAFFTFEEQYK